MNEFTDSYFDVNLSKSDFKNNVKELETKFSNMTVDEVYKKNKQKYNVNIIEDRINSLIINAPISYMFLVVVLIILPPVFLFIFLGCIFYMSEETFYSLIKNPQLVVLFFIFLMFNLGIFVPLIFSNAHFYELRFEGKKFKICLANKVIEKTLNENTRFILDSNDFGKVFFLDMESKEKKSLLEFKQIYIANFFAYKMNSYLLKVLEN